MPGHGLTPCARLYRIPAGVRYIVVGDQGDYGNGDLLQSLQGLAVQIVLDDDHGACGEQIFIWPEGVVAPTPATKEMELITLRQTHVELAARLRSAEALNEQYELRLAQLLRERSQP